MHTNLLWTTYYDTQDYDIEMIEVDSNLSYALRLFGTGGYFGTVGYFWRSDKGIYRLIQAENSHRTATYKYANDGLVVVCILLMPNWR